MKLFHLCSLILVCCLLSCQSQDQRVLKLGHGLNIEHSVHKAMVRMGEDLAALSDGKLQMQIFPSQQLGTERQCLELLQIGSLDLTKVSVGVMENFSPKMKVLGLPYIFRDRAHSFDVLDGPIGQSLLEGGSEYWLRGLGYYDAGSRSFYTKSKPVKTPDDLTGLKIRVMESVTAMDMVSGLGGSPTPISWGELYTALQQGVVDGAENNPPSFYLSKHYEVCKHYSLDEHTRLPDVLVMSLHTWELLSSQEKEWLNKAVKNSIAYQRILWADAETEALEQVQKAGVTIHRPVQSLFKSTVMSLYESYQDQPEYDKLIQDIINHKSNQ